MIQSGKSVRKTSIFLAANRDFQSDGLANLIDSSPDYAVVYRSSLDAHGWERVGAVGADLLLLRNVFTAPELLEQIKTFRRDFPEQKLVLLSEPLPQAQLCLCVKAGLSGFITTSCSSTELFKCLRIVAAGQIWIDRNILEDIVRDFHCIDALVAVKMQQRLELLAENLTKREREVFLKVIEGLSTKEIADKIHLSNQGVKLHLGRIFSKFGVSNRTQMVLEIFKKIFPVNDINLLFHSAIFSPVP